MVRYHDEEWGAPVHDDRALFEFLILEGAQAGLAWITILRKRENYREAFNNFDAGLIAGYDEAKIKSRHRSQPPEGPRRHNQRSDIPGYPA
jgi:DNA-3-methyladenine glycosylase I